MSYNKNRLLKIILIITVFCMSLFVLCCVKQENQVIVYCGSGLKEPMESVGNAFEKKHNIGVIIIDSGMKNLVEVIKETQIGDFFFYPSLSAKPKLPDLEQTTFCVGYDELVIVIHRDNPKNIQSFDDLTKDNIRIAVGDSAKTATGKLFENILIKTKKKEEIEKNIVFRVHASGEMIKLLIAEETDAVIILKSLLNSDKYRNFKAIEFPNEIKTSFGVYLSELRISKNKKATRLFSNFMINEGKEILHKWRIELNEN